MGPVPKAQHGRNVLAVTGFPRHRHCPCEDLTAVPRTHGPPRAPAIPAPPQPAQRANGALSPASESRGLGVVLTPRPGASFERETQIGPRGKSGQVLLFFLPFFKAGIQGEAKRRPAEQSETGPAGSQRGCGAGRGRVLSCARFPHYCASKSASPALSLFSKSQTQAMSLNRSNSSSPLRK